MLNLLGSYNTLNSLYNINKYIVWGKQRDYAEMEIWKHFGTSILYVIYYIIIL